MTALLVLASGNASRFEAGNKLLADLDGKPVVQHVIDAAKPVDFAGRYAVFADETVEQVFASQDYVCVRNLTPDEGMGSAMSYGVEQAIRDGCSSVLILLGDMPFIYTDHIKALLDTDDDVVMSEHAGIRMPPSIFRNEAMGELAYLSSDLGGKSTLNPETVKSITLSKKAARDIDTVQDLEMARRE